MATLSIEKYPQEGDLTYTYSALQNMLNDKDEIIGFNTNEIEVDLNNPLNIECQPSYDGTVNLIIMMIVILLELLILDLANLKTIDLK